MITPMAVSLATVNTIWTRRANLTLQQFTVVMRSTHETFPSNFQQLNPYYPQLTETHHSSQLGEQCLRFRILAQFKGIYQRIDGVFGETEATDGVGHGPEDQYGNPREQKCAGFWMDFIF
jgi:hypothetical protein